MSLITIVFSLLAFAVALVILGIAALPAIGVALAVGPLCRAWLGEVELSPRRFDQLEEVILNYSLGAFVLFIAFLMGQMGFWAMLFLVLGAVLAGALGATARDEKRLAAKPSPASPSLSDGTNSAN
ncbi:hypothetical protein Pan216_34740 [Planctomycetes bacterium Pan216]|uniref:Uncharacterized protein n=1 Tax=Kolteria novifilia TaxID=2527975 RepID=A0A518B6K3_9BACT|nr:hypothetical protein Pan216_34740 [Planctomycetes bacterium Pan216]